MNLYIVILLLIGHLSGVPFVSQEGEGADKYYYDCGPANVSMLLEYYAGIHVTPDTLMGYIGRDRYTYANELVNLTDRYWVTSKIQTFRDFDSLIVYAKHDPVIILSYHHWLLITGEHKGQVRYHDSLEGPDLLMDKDTLDWRWRISGLAYQGIVIEEVLHPDRWGFVE